MAEERHEDILNPRCQEFRVNLETYLEGEGALPAHARQCAACGALAADLALIRSAAQALPLESPAPRVWSNIHATLQTEGFFREPQSFWKRWVAPLHLSPSAAPVAAVVFLIVFAIFLFSPGSLYHRSESVGPVAAVATSGMAPASFSAVEANLVRTVQEMEKSYKAREAYLDPVTQQTYERGLTSLDNSIQECLASLQAQPQNSLARQYLMQAYSEKVDVLASALEYHGR